MSDVLHVQTRAYPTLHESLVRRVPDVLEVPGRGPVPATASSMRSLAYGTAPMVAVDLSPILEGLRPPEGVCLVGGRLRALRSGAVLLSYALRHERDLAALSVLELADLDVEVNHALRAQDEDLIGAVLTVMDEGAPPSRVGEGSGSDGGRGVLVGVDWPGRPFATGDPGAAGRSLPEEVRYNCHFVAPDLPWAADERALTESDLHGSSTCRPLLPYTFAWCVPAGAELDDVLAVLEGTDVAVAQRSVLAAAGNDGVSLLEHLADTAPAGLDLSGYRRYLDRIRACHHRLDSYRYDSSQEHRATYLAARREMDLDGIHDRTEALLQQVRESLGAAVDEQTQVLDGRLNRAAALLTVVAAGSFLFDTIGFVRGDDPFTSLSRQTIAALVWLGLIGVLIAVWSWRRRPGLRDRG